MSAGVTIDLSTLKPIGSSGQKPVTIDRSTLKPIAAASPTPSAQPPVTSTGKGQQSSFGRTFDRVAEGAVNMAPVLGQTAGGLLGAAAGPEGAITGAMLGGGAGEAFKEHTHGVPLSTREIGTQAAFGGVSEAGGMVAGKALGKAAEIAAPKLSAASEKIIARIIKPGTAGVKAGAKVANATEIAGAVSKVAGNAKSLSGLQQRVLSETERLNASTAEIVNTANPAAKIPVYNILIDKGSAAIEHLGDTHIGDKGKTIDSLVDLIREKAGADELSPQGALKLRRELYDIHWPSGTRQFRDELYRSLNKEIATSLPPEARAQFLANNQSVHRLIRARSAIDAAQYRKMVAAGKIALHGGIGGYAGYELGGKRGALAGALAGAALGSVPGELTAAQAARGAAAGARGLSAGRDIAGQVIATGAMASEVAGKDGKRTLPQ